jgi:excisionase family DNA binding protein
MSGNSSHETPAPGNTSEADRPRTYSVEEAARELSISRRKAWDLVWAKRLRAKQLDGRVVVTGDAIDEFIAALPDYEPRAVVAA